MARFSLLLLVALICAPAAFAQDRDYSFYEFYGGYAYVRGDNFGDTFDRNGRKVINGSTADLASERVGYNGFQAEFNQNVTRHIGIVTSFSGTYRSTTFFDRNTGRFFDANIQRYDLLAGPRYNWRPGGVTPFVHGLFGISHVRGRFADRVRSDTAFAMAFGGGLDVSAGEHVDVRVIQVDYLPTFFNGRRQDSLRAGAGIKIK